MIDYGNEKLNEIFRLTWPNLGWAKKPMKPFEPGDIVRFIGCTESQINWGCNDDPNPLLEVGYNYTIETVDIHKQHTKITLEGITGRFNSVCFVDANSNTSYTYVPPCQE